VVSDEKIRPRLVDNFVCVRLSWAGMQRAKQRHGLVGTTQGNQVLLDPDGKYLPDVNPHGKRYQIDGLAALLDRVHDRYPGRKNDSADSAGSNRGRDALRLEWFFAGRFGTGSGGQLTGNFISRVDRKPLAIVSGPIPEMLRDVKFLRRHLREFVWERGAEDGPARIVVRQFEPERRDLATIELDGSSAEQVGQQLDAAWLAYMVDRPMIARGYIDNPHGNWLKNVMEKVHQEELQVRDLAKRGTLTAPGRGEGE